MNCMQKYMKPKQVSFIQRPVQVGLSNSVIWSGSTWFAWINQRWHTLHVHFSFFTYFQNTFKDHYLKTLQNSSRTGLIKSHSPLPGTWEINGGTCGKSNRKCIQVPFRTSYFLGNSAWTSALGNFFISPDLLKPTGLLFYQQHCQTSGFQFCSSGICRT